MVTRVLTYANKPTKLCSASLLSSQFRRRSTPDSSSLNILRTTKLETQLSFLFFFFFFKNMITYFTNGPQISLEVHHFLCLSVHANGHRFIISLLGKLCAHVTMLVTNTTNKITCFTNLMNSL